jgi:CubicO group peptidase (beta-lactamase class C family)
MTLKYRFFQFCLLTLIAILAISCNGQTNSTSTKNNIESIANSQSKRIDELIKIYNFNEGFSGSVLVAQNGNIILKKGYGNANREWNIPNKPDTKFRIASVTKPFTSVLILQLVAENKIELHKPISTYLNDYPKEQGNKITIHHLLTHSSGLIRDVNTDKKQFHNPKQIVDLFANEQLLFEPGKRFEYSNCGYNLLGYIIEVVTGKSYQEVLEEKIFEPLNIHNSGYSRHRRILENRSSGYGNNFIDYRNSNYFDYSNAYASGAIYSTVEDMFLFDQALYSEKLIPKNLLDLAFSKHIADEKYGGHYGYGWEIIEKTIGNTENKIETISHSGSLPDYCAVFTRIPSTNTTIVLLGNTGRAWLNAITGNILAILNDEAYELPNKSATKVLYESIQSNGIAYGISNFKKIKDDSDYYVNENEMNVLSYVFLQEDKAKISASVLELAIEQFPKAFNLYDSYGEVLLNLGEKEKAIENYKKSIELNPDNKHGIEVLRKLEQKKE